MSILYLIMFSSFIIWILVPIRQYGTKYFPMFMLLALKDIIAAILYFVLNISSYKISIPINLLIFIALFNKMSRDNIYFIIPSFLFLTYLNFFILSAKASNSFHMFSSAVFLTFFMIKFFRKLYLRNTFSLFYALMFSYFLLTFTKYINAITFNIDNVVMYFMNTSIQIFIGLYLLKYTHLDNNFQIRK